MMMGSSPSSPSGLEALTSLLDLVTRPDEARAHLAEIARASLELDQKRTETQDLVKALKAEYAELQGRMARESDQHARKLASDRDKCDLHCNSAMDEVRRIREGVVAEQQLVGAHRQRAAELVNKYEARMKMIDEAAKI
jgi:tRNA U55 pseudouridine synthase TruB